MRCLHPSEQQLGYVRTYRTREGDVMRFVRMKQRPPLRQAEPVNLNNHDWVRELEDLIIQVVVIGLILFSIIGMCAIAAIGYYSGPVQ